MHAQLPGFQELALDILSTLDEDCTGNLYKAVPRLRECCGQVEAEEVSNSRSKIHQTWGQPYRDSLYVFEGSSTNEMREVTNIVGRARDSRVTSSFRALNSRSSNQIHLKAKDMNMITPWDLSEKLNFDTIYEVPVSSGLLNNYAISQTSENFCDRVHIVPLSDSDHGIHHREVSRGEE